MKPAEIDISIIVLEYRDAENLKTLIPELVTATEKLRTEIIISSNSGYGTEEQEIYRSLYPSARWLFNERNGGFSYGMNRGLAEAAGRYLTVMNTDVKDINGIDRLVRFMETNQGIGAVGPLVRNPEGEIQDSFRRYVTIQSYILRQLGRLIKRGGPSMPHNPQPQSVDWLAGSNITISRLAYDSTGGFNEAYFMYAEDMDLCHRIRMEGFDIVMFPGMEITFEGSRRARRSLKYAWIFVRSHMIFWRRFGFFDISPSSSGKIYNIENEG